MDGLKSATTFILSAAADRNVTKETLPMASTTTSIAIGMTMGTAAMPMARWFPGFLSEFVR